MDGQKASLVRTGNQAHCSLAPTTLRYKRLCILSKRIEQTVHAMQQPRPNSPGSRCRIDEDLIATLVESFLCGRASGCADRSRFEAGSKRSGRTSTKARGDWSSVVLKSGTTTGEPDARTRCHRQDLQRSFRAWLPIVLRNGSRGCAPPDAAALFIDRSQTNRRKSLSLASVSIAVTGSRSKGRAGTP